MLINPVLSLLWKVTNFGHPEERATKDLLRQILHFATLVQNDLYRNFFVYCGAQAHDDSEPVEESHEKRFVEGVSFPLRS